MSNTLLFRVLARLYVSPSKNRDDVIPFLWPRTRRIGQVITSMIVLVKGEDKQAVVLLGPVVVVADVLPQPRVAGQDAGRFHTVVHIIDKVRDYKGNSR